MVTTSAEIANVIQSVESSEAIVVVVKEFLFSDKLISLRTTGELVAILSNPVVTVARITKNGLTNTRVTLSLKFTSKGWYTISEPRVSNHLSLTIILKKSKNGGVIETWEPYRTVVIKCSSENDYHFDTKTYSLDYYDDINAVSLGASGRFVKC